MIIARVISKLKEHEVQISLIVSRTNFGIKNVFWELLLDENVSLAFDKVWKLQETLRRKPFKRA